MHPALIAILQIYGICAGIGVAMAAWSWWRRECTAQECLLGLAVMFGPLVPIVALMAVLL